MEQRVSTLEEAMVELAVAQVRTQQNLDRLSEEMRAFKGEMGAFKDEMGASMDRMQTWNKEADQRWHDAHEASGKAWRQQWGELSNRMGTLVEDIVAPSIPAVFCRYFGLDELEFAASRVRRRHRVGPGRTREFDYVAMAGRLVLVNETKSTRRPEDIPAFLALLGEVREFLPETDGREVVGSLASFYVDPSLVAAGERQGLLMFGLGSGLLDVLNSPGFEPRRF